MIRRGGFKKMNMYVYMCIYVYIQNKRINYKNEELPKQPNESQNTTKSALFYMY